MDFFQKSTMAFNPISIVHNYYERSLPNHVLACSRVLRALHAWRARVLGVLYVLACLAW